MAVESFSLLESGSTMPHRGIVLPLPLFFGNGSDRAAALRNLQRQRITTPSSLKSPSPNLFFLLLLLSLIALKIRRHPSHLT